jgi:tRNA(fMet)-specific endonuclease VapC
VKYLLDTDHVSFLQRPKSAEYFILTARISRHPFGEVVASVVSFHEQAIGIHALLNRARRPAEVIRGYELLYEVLKGYSSNTVLPFDAAAATAFDGLSGLGMAMMDRRIAAIALSNGLILLTRNRSDFTGIPGLVVEDWTI